MKKPFSEKGKPAVSVPVLTDMGVESLVTELHGKEGHVSIFKYHKDKMVRGYSTDYGHFTITSNPLEIHVSDRGQQDSLVCHREWYYNNVYVNSDGYVTSMDFEGKEVKFNGPDSTVHAFEGNVSVAYDRRGHVAAFNYEYDDAVGNKEAGKMRYEWSGNNLETIVSDVFLFRQLRESHEMFTFVYDTDSTVLNKGLYWEEMNPFSGKCDFLWYAGLFGKTQYCPKRFSKNQKKEADLRQFTLP